MTKTSSRAGVALVALATALGAEPACAQEAVSEAVGEGEIVVTAQRREQRLQDTPLSVTALSGDLLEERHVATIDEIARYSPNMRFDTTAAVSGARYSATVFVRGVGQNDYAVSTDPGVGVYVDGVYYARSIGGVLDAVDIEQVQILRGPQGTLFGRNTIAGAVLVTTAQPDDEFSGSIRGTIGEFNRADVKAAINIPLIEDELFTRVSLASINRDGYQTRLSDGESQGNRNADIIRWRTLWTPSSDLSVDFNVDYTRAREQSAPSSVLAVAPGPGLTGAPFLTTYNAVVAPTLGITAPNGLPTLNSSWVTNDPDTTWAGGHNVNNLDMWGAAATVEWDLGAVNFTSISAYRHMSALFGRDGDNTPFTFRESIFDVWQHQLSQEFQLSGSTDRLQWIAGLYYLEEQGRDYGFLDLGTGSPIVVTQSNDVNVDNSSIAAYGQATYNLTDRLAITAGARVNRDTKHMTVSNLSLANATISAVRDGEWTSTTPMARVEYSATDDVLIYASYSQGFKSGGFNSRALTTAAELTTYNPEEAISYELGAKTSWLDGRLVLNGAVFLVDYTDIQQSVIQTPQTFIANAAEAEISGVELEAFYRPTDHIEMNLAAGYTDAHYTSIGTGNPLQVLPISLSSLFVKVPEWTVSAGIQVTQPIGGGGELVWQADASYFSSYANDVSNTPELIQPAYTVGNISLTYKSLEQPWQIGVFVNNVTDERYLVAGNRSSGFGLIEGHYSEPRQWGVTLGVEF